MKKIFIAISILPLLAEAQSITHSVFLAPNFSFYASSNSEVYPNKGMKSINYWNFGAVAGYRMEYYFPKIFVVGTSIEYLLTRAELYTDCYCFHTMDRNISIRNFITANSIDAPIYFKLKTNKNENRFTYVQSGIGLSWLFNAYRNVKSETDFLNNKEPLRTQIVNEPFSLQNNNSNKLGSFFQFGIGQSFQIKQINFFAALSYRQDINSWIYKTVATPDGAKEFPIQRQSVLLKIGIAFNQKKKESQP
jgi:hypothetical protein